VFDVSIKPGAGQLSDAPIDYVRHQLVHLARNQYDRKAAA
jgi:hypothetical protein